jgi:hypothetical protein
MEIKIGKKKTDNGTALRYALTHIHDGNMETINFTVDTEEDMPKMLAEFTKGTSVILSVVRTR